MEEGAKLVVVGVGDLERLSAALQLQPLAGHGLAAAAATATSAGCHLLLLLLLPLLLLLRWPGSIGHVGGDSHREGAGILCIWRDKNLLSSLSPPKQRTQTHREMSSGPDSDHTCAAVLERVWKFVGCLGSCL